MTWEQRPLFDKINDRLEQLERKYQRFQTARDTITEYFRPDLNWQVDESGRGGFLGESIYEGTAPWAARVMATGFQGNLVSPSIDWLMYIMDAFELRGIDQLDTWCQDVKDHMSQVYRKSNFYSVLPQYTLDGLTLGSPVMFGEEEIATGRIQWMPQHYQKCYLSYDKYNQVDGIIIKDATWTAKQIADVFCSGRTPEERKASREKKLSISLNNLLAAGKYYDEFAIIRAVFKYDDPMWDGPGFEKPLGDARWISVYFEDATEKDKNTPLETKPYYSRPFVNWDYNKKPYEAVSRTPAYDAIYDVISHQQVHKNFLENIQLKNRPPRFSLNSLQGRLELGAEGVTYVSDREYDKPPKMVDLLGDVPLNKELSDIFSAAIQRHFHLDLFQLFTSVAMAKRQPLTATQIWQMAGEKATLLSPAVETYSKDLLKPADDRMMDIEMRAGRGPFAPDVIANIVDIVMSNSSGPVRSISVTPEFVGPLARAQKMQQALEPIQAGVEIASGIADRLDPDLRFALKGYETIEDALKAVNFPMKNLKTEADFKALIDALNQQRAQDANFAKQIEAAKATRGLTGAVDKTSIVNQLTGAAA